MKIDFNLSKDLALLGLSDYEMRVFAASYSLKFGSATTIAKLAKIPRPSVYPVLNTLISKGLISVVERAGASAFVPASPDTLITIAEDRLADAQAGVKASRRLAETLRSVRGPEALTSAKVLIFEGKKAISQMLTTQEKEWRDSAIRLNRDWVGFQDATFLKHYGNWVIKYWQKYNNLGNHKQDKVRIFSIEDPDTKQIAKVTTPLAGDRRQLRSLPNEFAFTATVWIVGEYVIALKTRSDPHYALQIRDEVLAENLTAVFDLLWAQS